MKIIEYGKEMAIKTAKTASRNSFKSRIPYTYIAGLSNGGGRAITVFD
jgi:hypothetical protein